MTQPSRLCEQCGATMNPGAGFCGQCGHAVQPPPQPATATSSASRVAAAAPAAQPQPAASAEPILGIIPALQRRKGFLGTSVENWTLVVTPQRLAFAQLTRQMMNDAVRDANVQAKQEGKGFLQQIAAQMGWLSIVGQHYQSLPIERTLAEHAENLFIAVSQVRRVRVEHTVHRDGQRRTTSDVLVIEDVSGKFQFELKDISPDDARRVLQQALGAAAR